MSDDTAHVDDFLRAASVPREDEGASSHVAGTLERAEEILAAHPEVATASVHVAAALGDDAAVRRLLAQDAAAATGKGGPFGWDPLTHLCFSRYLRLDPARSAGLVRAAEALLDAGADPNTGFFEASHQPKPEWESALYGAAGVAHHAALTRLLLERGGDPNDNETPYHAPEGYDNEALYALVESGKLTDDSLRTILLRKTDWHDLDAIRWLLEHGADPNGASRWGKTALHNAILSDNGLAIIQAMLDHGGDPTLVSTHPDRSPGPTPPRSGVEMAARRGRRDILELCARRGISVDLEGVAGLIAACACADAAAARRLATAEPALLDQLRAEGGMLLAEFAGNGNTDGVRLLLDLGVPVSASFERGDGYFDIAPRSTALHVAAWRARPDTVRLLLERGARPDAIDGRGRTPLQRAVQALVDSWWSDRASPDTVAALLGAGASPTDIPYPSGSAAVDELLRRYGPGA